MFLDGYEVERFPLQDLDGGLVALVVAKKAWTIGEDRVLRPAGDPEPVLFANLLESGDDPTASPVRIEADTALVKPKADLVVIGTAYAPGGDPAPSFEVGVTLGSHRRTLRIFGPRRAIYRKPARETKAGGGGRVGQEVLPPPLFTDPTPVRRVAMSFTNSYGGVARYRIPGSEDVLEIPCPCNPFGKGYCVQNSPEALDGLDLPQIEDPAALLAPETLVREIGAPENLPLPAGLGFFGSGWYPRVAYAGVMPHEVERVRAQVREQAAALDPEKDAAAIEMLRDFDPPVLAPEFFQGAAPGMTVPYPRGDESVVLKNLSPSGHLAFNLPGLRPLVTLDLGRGQEVVPMALDTVLIVSDEARLVLTFRGRVSLGSPELAESLPTAPLELHETSVGDYERALADRMNVAPA